MEETGEAKTRKMLNTVYQSKATSKPKVGDLILEAIRKDGDKRGTSLALIKKYIQANYPELNLIQMKRNILKFIRSGLQEGSLKSKNNSMTARLKIVGDQKAKSGKNAAAPKKDKPKKVISEQEKIIPPLPFGESSKAQPIQKQRKRKLLESVDTKGAPNEKVKVARKKIRKSMTVVQPPKTPKPKRGAASKLKTKAAKTAKDPKKRKAPRKAKEAAKLPKEMAEEP